MAFPRIVTHYHSGGIIASFIIDAVPRNHFLSFKKTFSSRDVNSLIISNKHIGKMCCMKERAMNDFNRGFIQC